MSAINVKLPDSLHKMAKKAAQKDRITLNQLITSAVAEKLSSLTTEEYLQARAKRASRHKFLRALSQVPAREPEPRDRL